MAKSRLVKANQKIEKKVADGYKKIEKGVVDGFNKIADGFVDQYLTREGESVEEARKRLAMEQKEMEEQRRKMMEWKIKRRSSFLEKQLVRSSSAFSAHCFLAQECA